VLTETLRAMERDGLITRPSYPEIPYPQADRARVHGRYNVQTARPGRLLAVPGR
jgi:hypothetical protein